MARRSLRVGVQDSTKDTPSNDASTAQRKGLSTRSQQRKERDGRTSTPATINAVAEQHEHLHDRDDVEERIDEEDMEAEQEVLQAISGKQAQPTVASNEDKEPFAAQLDDDEDERSVAPSTLAHTRTPNSSTTTPNRRTSAVVASQSVRKRILSSSKRATRLIATSEVLLSFYAAIPSLTDEERASVECFREFTEVWEDFVRSKHDLIEDSANGDVNNFVDVEAFRFSDAHDLDKASAIVVRKALIVSNVAIFVHNVYQLPLHDAAEGSNEQRQEERERRKIEELTRAQRAFWSHVAQIVNTDGASQIDEYSLASESYFKLCQQLAAAMIRHRRKTAAAPDLVFVANCCFNADDVRDSLSKNAGFAKVTPKDDEYIESVVETFRRRANGSYTELLEHCDRFLSQQSAARYSEMTSRCTSYAQAVVDTIMRESGEQRLFSETPEQRTPRPSGEYTPRLSQAIQLDDSATPPRTPSHAQRTSRTAGHAQRTPTSAKSASRQGLFLGSVADDDSVTDDIVPRATTSELYDVASPPARPPPTHNEPSSSSKRKTRFPPDAVHRHVVTEFEEGDSDTFLEQAALAIRKGRKKKRKRDKVERTPNSSDLEVEVDLRRSQKGKQRAVDSTEDQTLKGVSRDESEQDELESEEHEEVEPTSHQAKGKSVRPSARKGSTSVRLQTAGNGDDAFEDDLGDEELEREREEYKRAKELKNSQMLSAQRRKGAANEGAWEGWSDSMGKDSSPQRKSSKPSKKTDDRAPLHHYRYATGVRQNGQQAWTKEETKCLVDELNKIFPRGVPKDYNARHSRIYTQVLDSHGPNGTSSTILAKRTNVQLKDKVVTMIRVALREGKPMPKWSGLYSRL